jgi:hypothetical protein
MVLMLKNLLIEDINDDFVIIFWTFIFVRIYHLILANHAKFHEPHFIRLISFVSNPSSNTWLT